MRSALGATRGRIAAQLLVESLVLGALGGVAGRRSRRTADRGCRAAACPGLPFTSEITLNWRVLAFASAAALGVSMLVGLMPAIRMSTGSAAAALNSASRGSSGANDRTRRVIVAAEVAVSVVLICGAALLFKSLAQHAAGRCRRAHRSRHHDGDRSAVCPLSERQPPRGVLSAPDRAACAPCRA